MSVAESVQDPGVDMAGGLARAEPSLTPDILFGAAALLELEGRFASHLMDSWSRAESSLVSEHVMA